jgi:hypothetical protein
VAQQLECLNHIRHVFVEYGREVHLNGSGGKKVWWCLDLRNLIPSSLFPTFHFLYRRYCVVRQAILCTADTTLEPTHHGGPNELALEDRNDDESTLAPASRSCRNWTQVKAWIEDNRVGKLEANRVGKLEAEMEK